MKVCSLFLVVMTLIILLYLVPFIFFWRSLQDVLLLVYETLG